MYSYKLQRSNAYKNKNKNKKKEENKVLFLWAWECMRSQSLLRGEKREWSHPMEGRKEEELRRAHWVRDDGGEEEIGRERERERGLLRQKVKSISLFLFLCFSIVFLWRPIMGSHISYWYKVIIHLSPLFYKFSFHHSLFSLFVKS